MRVTVLAVLVLLTYHLLQTGAEKSSRDIILDNTGLNMTEFGDWVENWEAPEEIVKLAPYYKAGFDEDGVPVYVHQMGRWSMVGVGQLTEDKKQMYWNYLEQAYQRMKRDGLSNNDQGVALIVDWDGFDLSSIANSEGLPASLRSISSLPRMGRVLKYIFMINTNFTAQTFLNMIRPFMGTLMEKMEMYGTQPEQWKTRLLRKIPRSQLPPEYGGDQNFTALAYGNYKTNNVL